MNDETKNLMKRTRSLFIIKDLYNIIPKYLENQLH